MYVKQQKNDNSLLFMVNLYATSVANQIKTQTERKTLRTLFFIDSNHPIYRILITPTNAIFVFQRNL